MWLKECQDAKQRLSNNSDMVNLRNKIQQQDSEIAGWRKKMINMQTQLLTQEKKYKETFKIQEHDLEKERQQWKNSKRQMEEQILSVSFQICLQVVCFIKFKKLNHITRNICCLIPSKFLELN